MKMSWQYEGKSHHWHSFERRFFIAPDKFRGGVQLYDALKLQTFKRNTVRSAKAFASFIVSKEELGQ